jgi:hypothetical protein
MSHHLLQAQLIILLVILWQQVKRHKNSKMTLMMVKLRVMMLKRTLHELVKLLINEYDKRKIRIQNTDSK